jgi:hypothetical protein
LVAPSLEVLNPKALERKAAPKRETTECNFMVVVVVVVLGIAGIGSNVIRM